MRFSEPFLTFIKKGENEEVKFLAEKYKLHMVADALGATLLHYAAEHGNLEITQYLLHKGSNINAQNAKQQTPLMKSIEGKHHLVAQFLLEAGADISHSLHLAVRLSDAKSVRLLLEFGADIEALDRQGATPLFYLHLQNKRKRECETVEILRILLKLGVSLTRQVVEGYLSIGFTLSQGSCEAVRLVLQSNIDFSARDDYGKKTLLHFLAMNPDRGIVEEIRPYIDKFDVNAVDKWGGSSVHEAVIRGNTQMAEFLLDRGAKPSVYHNRYRMTTLLSTFAYSSPGTEEQYDRCLELLLQHGADPQEIMINNVGKTITIVNAAILKEKCERLKIGMAQIAICERQNIKIAELITSQINSHPESEVYLKRCRRLLNKKIAGTITIYKLLTADEKTMAKYLSNDKLLMSLMRISHKQKLQSCYSYFYNTFVKRFSKGFLYKTLRDKGTTVITRLLGNRLDESNIIIENITANLSNQDLRQLYQM